MKQKLQNLLCYFGFHNSVTHLYSFTTGRLVRGRFFECLNKECKTNTYMVK